MKDEQRLRELYDAFNARDIETALAAMIDDVDWPNAWEGGRVQGREAVRSYWTRQWAELDSWVEPVTVRTRSDGRVAVDVRQAHETWRAENAVSFTSTSCATGWSRGWTSRNPLRPIER